MSTVSANVPTAAKPDASLPRDSHARTGSAMAAPGAPNAGPMSSSFLTAPPAAHASPGGAGPQHGRGPAEPPVGPAERADAPPSAGSGRMRPWEPGRHTR